MASEPAGRLDLLVFRPTLGQGGADRVTLHLLRSLPRERFRISLALMRREGELLDQVPGDVRQHALGARSLWSAAPPLARLCRELDPDVLFSTSSGGNVAACAAARLRPVPRLVLSERGLLLRGRPSPKRAALLLLKRLLYPRADLVTAVSQGVRDELLARLRLEPQRVAVVYSPALPPDLEELAAREPSHPWLRDGAPVILAAGRLVAEKDFSTLLAAFARIRKERAARLVILGEGPLRPALEARVRRLGLEGEVSLPGFEPNPFPLYARCTIFVLSSRHEGLPGALIQAMSCGAPVIATDCPSGPAEIVSDGEDGFLVPVGDPAALAEKMALCLDRPDLRLRLGKRARGSSRRFGAEAVLARHIEALEGEPAAAKG